MKKNILIVFVLLFLVVLIAPIGTTAQTFNPKVGLVPCGKAANGSDACTILDFFGMLARIYSFIVWNIATPLAVLALTIGGIFMMISAGNPNLFSKGKEILKWAIIGLVLVFGSWLIIDFILGAIGYSMGKPWSQL